MKINGFVTVILHFYLRLLDKCLSDAPTLAKQISLCFISPTSYLEEGKKIGIYGRMFRVYYSAPGKRRTFFHQNRTLTLFICKLNSMNIVYILNNHSINNDHCPQLN